MKKIKMSRTRYKGKLPLHLIVKNKYGYLASIEAHKLLNTFFGEKNVIAVRKNEEIIWVSLLEAEKHLLKEEPTQTFGGE